MVKMGHVEDLNALNCLEDKLLFCVIELVDVTIYTYTVIRVSYRPYRRISRLYYPNIFIMIVDNNEHQRIDNVSTDRFSKMTLYKFW